MTPFYERDGITLFNTPAMDVARSLGDDSVDLIICDWPYFRVKSEAWDNQWHDSVDFLAWMGEHLAEFQRILKPNGSYYGFASPQMAARVEVLTEQYFNVLNSIRWVKDEGWHKKADEGGLRSYLSPWEAVIFAEHHNADNIASGEAGYVTACDKLRGFVFEPLRAYLDGEKARAGWTTRQVAEAFQKKTGSRTVTGMAGHWFSSVQWTLPTVKNYQWLQELFNHNQSNEYLRREYEYLRREYEYLRREYEELRREYEALRRPFNAHRDAPYTDVWTFPTVGAHRGKHPCAKPGAMFRHIIEMSSKPGGAVFDPMCGSGGSALAARNLGRVWIGGDMDARWCDATVKRLARSMDDWQPRVLDGGELGPLFEGIE